MTKEKLVIDSALELSIRMIGAVRKSESCYGWGFKSAGCKVGHERFGSAWLKVRKSLSEKMNRRLWDGELMTIPFENVPKPVIYGHFDWSDQTHLYRAILMEVTNPAISATPNPTRELHLSNDWWTELRSAVLAIRSQGTERPSIRDDLMMRRLKERYQLDFIGPAPLRETAHSDLHWANLTADPLRILDWESWGRGPFGLDTAYLHVFSVSQPALLGTLKDVFSDIISRPEYELTFLFCAAEIQRMCELYGVYTEIQTALKTEAAAILADCRIFDLPCLRVR